MGGLWQCFTHIIVISYWQLNDIDTSMTLSILKSFCQRCEIVFMLRNWDGIRYQLSAAHQLPYTSTDDTVLVGWFNSKVHCWYTYIHACMHAYRHTYIHIYIYIYVCVDIPLVDWWYPHGPHGAGSASRCSRRTCWNGDRVIHSDYPKAWRGTLNVAGSHIFW